MVCQYCGDELPYEEAKLVHKLYNQVEEIPEPCSDYICQETTPCDRCGSYNLVENTTIYS